MSVIPVLDIAGGRVVHARRGERTAYRPIVSPLASGSLPVAVGRALLDRVPTSDALYVADLDALTGLPVQCDAIAALASLACEIWIDAGFATLAAAQELLASLANSGVRARPVFGSESLADSQALQSLAEHPSAILSLDTRKGHPLDPAGAWRDVSLWPETVIVMTLDRVGAEAGPDLETFAQLRSRAPDRTWIGAGGITSIDDLVQAEAAGAAGWLVASALHSGQVDLR